MSDIKKLKDASPLVQSVLSVDSHVAELERLSARIDEMKLNTESDHEQVRKLMAVFAEHGNAVSTEIVELSKHLLETRSRAEAAAGVVAAKAGLLENFQNEEAKKMASLRALAAKVNQVGQGI